MFWNVASALGSDFTAQMVWCGTAQLHFAVKRARANLVSQWLDPPDQNLAKRCEIIKQTGMPTVSDYSRIFI